MSPDLIPLKPSLAVLAVTLTAALGGCATSTTTTASSSGRASFTEEEVRVCDAIGLMGTVVVDGRRAGLSKRQQVAALEPNPTIAAVQRAHIDGVYSVRRPANDAEWSALRIAAHRAGVDACLKALKDA